MEKASVNFTKCILNVSRGFGSAKKVGVVATTPGVLSITLAEPTKVISQNISSMRVRDVGALTIQFHNGRLVCTPNQIPHQPQYHLQTFAQQ